jgi:hypothetical protein
MFGSDPVTDIVLRGTSTSATTTTPSWAAAIAGQAVEDSVAAITSLSAGAALIGRGLKANLSGIATLKIPGRLLDASDAGGWLAEGTAVPVRPQRFNTGGTLQPRKLMLIVTYTREMARAQISKQ